MTMHETIHEPARETPVAAECDVLVCGGGPAGFGAAAGFSPGFAASSGYFSDSIFALLRSSSK